MRCKHYYILKSVMVLLTRYVQLTYDTTSDYRLTDGHLLTTRKLTGLNSRRTQS